MPIYMKYEGVNGDMTGKYRGWIELESVQLGVIRANSSTDRERKPEQPRVSEIVITKLQDIASSALFRESLNGKGKKVIIDFVRAEDDTQYLRIELENVLISSFSVSGHGGPGSSPMESLSLNFAKITYTTTASAPVK